MSFMSSLIFPITHVWEVTPSSLVSTFWVHYLFHSQPQVLHGPRHYVLPTFMLGTLVITYEGGGHIAGPFPKYPHHYRTCFSKEGRL